MSASSASVRPLRAHWIGPLPYRNGIYRIESGLYLIMAGQSLLFAGGAINVSAALNRHLMFSERGVSPHDMAGRELIHYAQRYSEPLSLKLGEVYADGVKVVDQDTLDDAVSLLVYEMHPPCNLYGRTEYEGYQALAITHTGKHFPLPPRMEATPTHGRPRPAPPPPPEPPADRPAAAPVTLRESFD
jgi:hypothetical protein